MSLWSYRLGRKAPSDGCGCLAEDAFYHGLGTKIVNAIAEGAWRTKAADALVRRKPDKARVAAILRRHLMFEQQRILAVKQHAREMAAARACVYREIKANARSAGTIQKQQSLMDRLWLNVFVEQNIRPYFPDPPKGQSGSALRARGPIPRA
jgi:hypothetical protein